MKISSGTLKIIGVVFGVTAIGVVVVQWRVIQTLRSTNEVLRQEQTGSVVVAERADPAFAVEPSADVGEHRELLRLRNEVRELRERAALPKVAANTSATPITAHVPARPQTQAQSQQPAPAAIQRTGLSFEYRRMEQFATNKYANALERLARAGTEMERYFALGDAAKLSFAFGQTEKAATYAGELLALADKFKHEPWNRGCGDAVYAGNLVLGRLALEQGAIEDAKRYLLEAAGTDGSPVLGSFGPNTSLAQELLERGEREAVLQYFERCGNFWKSEKLQRWTEDVNAGRMPQFGANLIY